VRVKKMANNQRDTLIQILIVLIVAIVGLALVSSLFGGGMMGGGMMGGMMGFGWIFMLLPIIFIIFLIYALMDRSRSTFNQPPYPPQYPPPYQMPHQESGNPMQVLERRYVNGEISRNDYLRIKKDIEK
jgi:putative membrane protein